MANCGPQDTQLYIFNTLQTYHKGGAGVAEERCGSAMSNN
jgi:hypothetical protein